MSTTRAATILLLGSVLTFIGPLWAEEATSTWEVKVASPDRDSGYA